jgi:hypothetical protein
LDPVRWAGLPEAVRQDLLDSLRVDLQECLQDLQRASDANELLRVQGTARYLSRKITALEKMAEPKKEPEHGRSTFTGY